MRVRRKGGKLALLPYGKLDERDTLSKSIKNRLDDLKKKTGQDWKVVSISTSMVLSDVIFTILLGSP